MSDSGCGYHSCPCRGINFISRGFKENDYCIDGKRVHVRDGDPIVYRAIPAEVERLAIYFLDRYALYIEWHVKQKQKHPEWVMELQPFDHAWPLTTKDAAARCVTTDELARERELLTPEDRANREVNK